MTTTDTNRAKAEAVSDPIIDAINAYHEGNAAYLRHPLVNKVNFTKEEEQTAIAETYGLVDGVLQEWESPAVTRAGAMAALRLAQAEAKDFSASAVLTNMIDAAVAYFNAEKDREIDLEGELHDIRNMADITADLLEDGIATSHQHVTGHPDMYRLTSRQRDRIMFAAYETERRVRRLMEKLEREGGAS